MREPGILQGSATEARDVLTARAVTARLDASAPDPRILLSAATIIRQGGLVAYPTETYYGLAADPFNAAAVARLAGLKGRISPRALILLIARADMAFDLADLGATARAWYDKLARRFWPGPLTLVLPLKRRLRLPAAAGGSTVAVRVSSHPVAQQLVGCVGAPITSTSANMTGQPPATSAAELDARLTARLDLVLDAGRSPGGPPSSILDLSGDRPMLSRVGAIDADMIAGVLGFRPLVRPSPASEPEPQVNQ